MGTATVEKTAKKSGGQKEKIKKAYIEYVLENGSRPASIFKFVKDLKIKEEVFYDHFNSFENLEKAIWLGMLEETLDMITAEEVYSDYSAREKLLAFYYSFVEVLKKNRSFILQTDERSKFPGMTPYYLESLRKRFKEFVQEILVDAKESKEVVDRKYISDKYDEGIWIQFLFVVHFWIRDDSPAFEKTDAAIEKAVNLSFDLMGQGPLEAMIDFGKFLFQNR